MRSIIRGNSDDLGHEALADTCRSERRSQNGRSGRGDGEDQGRPISSSEIVNEEAFVRRRYIRATTSRPYHAQPRPEEGKTFNEKVKVSEGLEDLAALIEQCEEFISSTGGAISASGSNGTPTMNEEEYIGDSQFAFSCILDDISSKRQHGTAPRTIHAGLTILVQLVLYISSFAVLRVSYCLSVTTVRLGSMCEDEVILKQVLPSLLLATEDKQNAQVRAAAIRAVAVIFSLVENVAVVDEDIFPTYIFPAFNRTLKDQDVVVRVAFAASMGLIAESSKRFLDKGAFRIYTKDG